MAETEAPPGASAAVRGNPPAAGRDVRRFAGVRLVDLERIRERIPAKDVGVARLVLLALAELHTTHYDPNRPEYVRARVEDVAAYAGVTARTIYRVLPLLVDEKLIGYRRGRGTLPSTWRIRPIGTTSTYAPRPDTASSGSHDEKSQRAAPRPDTTSQPPVRGSISRDVSTSPIRPSEEVLAGAREAPPVPDGRTEGDCIEEKSVPPELAALLDGLGGNPPDADDLAVLVAEWEADRWAITAVSGFKAVAPMAAFLSRIIRHRWHEQPRWQEAGRRLEREAASASRAPSRFAIAAGTAEPVGIDSTAVVAARRIIDIAEHGVLDEAALAAVLDEHHPDLADAASTWSATLRDLAAPTDARGDYRQKYRRERAVADVLAYLAGLGDRPAFLDAMPT